MRVARRPGVMPGRVHLGKGSTMTAELIELNPVICRQESLVAMPACVRRRTTEIVAVYCATCPHLVDRHRL